MRNTSYKTSRRAMLGGALAGAGAVLAGSSASAHSSETLSRRFQGRTVLITGATSGIGEATALAFARKGAQVVFNGRREDLGRAVQSRINEDGDVRASGGAALYHPSDVLSPEEVEAFVDFAIAQSGHVDIAFNNAGIVFGRGSLTGNKPLAEIDVEDFDDVMSTNTRGVFLSMKSQIPAMLSNAAWGRFGLKGVIINNASVSAHGGFAGISPYSTSKHAVLGLTRNAALDYGREGIRVLSISPGGVDTPMRRASIRAQGRDPEDAQAPNIAHRTNTVEEMADVVLYLASADAPSAIAGTDIDVTMGMLTGPFAPPAG